MGRTMRVRTLAAGCLLVLAACGTPPPPPGDSKEGAAEEPAAPAVSAGLRSLNGTEIFVKRMGAGEPILVIHGGPVLDHGYLLPHLAPLAERHELVFADQRVSGRSAAAVDPETLRLATLVDDIDALRRDLGHDEVHLMAHSWGGLLALRYALDHPGALRSLILLSPMSASSELWRQEQQAQAEAADPADQAARQEIIESDAFAAEDPEAIAALLRLAFAGQFHDRERVRELELYVPADYMARSRLFSNLMADLADYALHPRLAELEVPTLILFGAEEAGARLGGPEIDAALPNSTLVLLEASGHFPFIERREAVLARVEAFLEQVAGR